jgi:glycosyltransferase involved in cell wall biosynthesis
MGYELGIEGVNLAWAIRDRRADHPLFEVPLNNRLVDHSLGLIFHSQAVAGMLAEQTEKRPLHIIPALMERRTGQSRRDSLGLSPDTIVFASLGLVTAEKRLDLALEAFSQLRREIPDSHFLIVGDVHKAVDLPELIGRFSLEEAVTCLGFVEDLHAFVDWIATADIIINLRYPTVGESSATALRAMAAGKPVIVFDLGWYGELPDSAVVKVRPLDNEGLLAAMQQLAQQPDLRHQLGETAAAHIEQHHDPARIASQYIAFARVILAGLNRKFEAARD